LGSKAKDESMARMSQQLVELLDLQNRSKLRVLGFVSSEEKVTVMKEYDSMREKIEQLLRTQKGIYVPSDTS
jgi:hypothetical protein